MLGIFVVVSIVAALFAIVVYGHRAGVNRERREQAERSIERRKIADETRRDVDGLSDADRTSRLREWER